MTTSSNSVHLLLRHLRAAGLEVPEVLGHDEDGREVLSWIDGFSGQDASGALRVAVQTDQVLVETAELIRRAHDATASFDTRALSWDPLLQDPSGADEIVCHNDLSFWNVIFREGRPKALIDWEFAAPGSRLWDLAYAAWWLVPLHRPEAAAFQGWRTLDQPRRLRMFVDAYGLDESRAELLDVVHERQLATQRQLRRWVADGTISPLNEEDSAKELGRTDYVDDHRHYLETALLANGSQRSVNS
jgi:aminoglycoside phosphotransferase (APT) family kinase protein